MVFQSAPVYSDHPNWHQLQQPNHLQGCGNQTSQLQPPPQPPQVVAGGGSIRPGSMVDRARLSKIPQPEAGLKCPRCESTNTKFCYFNNYSLSQPRHFCKTCRRYWTRGGAMRNVPVGGGCRRNKRSKSGSSKSQVPAENPTGTKSTSTSPSSCSIDIPSHFPQPSPQFPFMAALQNLGHYGGGNMGVAGFQPQMAAAGGVGQTTLGFQIGNNSGGADHWRLPFLAGLETPTNFYPYQSHETVEAPPSTVEDSQLRAVKMEENPGLNLSRHFMGISENNQCWSGNSWTEISGLNSSSTSHLL